MRQCAGASESEVVSSEAMSQLGGTGVMPSEERLIRKRSKSRAFQKMRSRMINYDVEKGFSAENPGSNSPTCQTIMAATPQPRWQASHCSQMCHFLVKRYAQKHFPVFLITLFVLMLLGYYLSSGFFNSVSSSKYNLRNDENPSGQSLEKTYTWKAWLTYFFPITCVPKENQDVKTCGNRGDLKESECLAYKCCYSSRISNFSCFVPFKDKPTQVFRVFGICVISTIMVGCLPIYCCGLFRRSKWVNPLQRRANRILKRLKKQRNKRKRDVEMLGTAPEAEEELTEGKEEDTKALLPK